MSKTETDAVRVKAAYIRPSIACFAVDFSLCAGSPPFNGGHKGANSGGSWDEQGDTSGGAGVADFGGTWTEKP